MSRHGSAESHCSEHTTHSRWTLECMVSWKLTCISSRAHCSFSRGRCGSNRKRSFFSHLSKHRSQHAAWLCCASIPSAPLSLRLAPAATAVVEMVVVCKCKCKQNSRKLCFGLPAVDDFAHGGIDSSNSRTIPTYPGCNWRNPEKPNVKTD